MITKEQIFKKDDLQTATVDVPEWGGKIIVRTMTGHDRQTFYDQMAAAGGKNKVPKYFQEMLIIATAINGDGRPLFSNDDLKQLSEKNARIINRIFETAAELNALTEGSIDEIAGE